jgi:hypothetical protein
MSDFNFNSNSNIIMMHETVARFNNVAYILEHFNLDFSLNELIDETRHIGILYVTDRDLHFAQCPSFINNFMNFYNNLTQYQKTSLINLFKEHIENYIEFPFEIRRALNIL